MARKAYERKISHANKYNAIFVELLERSVNCQFFPKKYFNTYVSHFQLGVCNLHEFPLMPSLFTSSFHYPSPSPRGFCLKAKSQGSTLTIHGTVFLCFQYYLLFCPWRQDQNFEMERTKIEIKFSLRCRGLKIAAIK